MTDLTILYLTANQLPDKFAEYQREVLREAKGDYPLVSISRKPIEFGLNLLDTGAKGVDNIYRQMLRGAHFAMTDYIAIAEDDCLYHKEHFNFFRPKSDEFAYNQNRFALFTWGEPIYSWRDRVSNCSLIAPRKLLIEALEERFAKYPNPIPDNLVGEVGRERIEKNLGVKVRKSVRPYSEVSIIQFNHDGASEDRQIRHRKKLGQIKVYDMYHWGHAKNLRKHYEN